MGQKIYGYKCKTAPKSKKEAICAQIASLVLEALWLRSKRKGGVSYAILVGVDLFAQLIHLVALLVGFVLQLT